MGRGLSLWLPNKLLESPEGVTQRFKPLVLKDNMCSVENSAPAVVEGHLQSHSVRWGRAMVLVGVSLCR